MPSKTQRKIQFAAKRHIYVGYVEFQGFMFERKTGWYVIDDRLFGAEKANAINLDYVHASFEHHGPYLSKRQAKNIAYSLAVGQENVV